MTTFRERPISTESAWHAGFLALLPSIYDQVCYMFRGLRPESKEEAVQGSLANAAVAYARLHEQGRADIAYATPLANFAVRQFLSGRRVGEQLNLSDVMSRHGQRHHNLVVERLDRRDDGGEWMEILVEDHRSTPAETAIARIDFSEWLSQLCRRDRDIATTLATGERTRDTAKKFGVTAGRISQVRARLKRNWEEFQVAAVDTAGELAMASC